MRCLYEDDWRSSILPFAYVRGMGDVVAFATGPGSITSYDRLQWCNLDALGNCLEVQNDGDSQTCLPDFTSLGMQ